MITYDNYQDFVLQYIHRMCNDNFYTLKLIIFSKRPIFRRLSSTYVLKSLQIFKKNISQVQKHHVFLITTLIIITVVLVFLYGTAC